MLGGTFDPPHFGHLAAALEVRHLLGLSKVLLVVANDPWQKSSQRPVTPAKLRLEMARAAVAQLDALEASSLEIERGGESYMVDTLNELRRLHPEAELVLVVGSDVAAGIDTWKRPEKLRRLATIVEVDRRAVVQVDRGSRWSDQVVRVPALDISSCDIRARLADGRPAEALLPAAVLEIVRAEALYGCAR